MAGRIRLIVLDVGGTIIQDHGDVPDALQAAFAKRGIQVALDEIARWHLASKRTARSRLTKTFRRLRGPKRPSVICEAKGSCWPPAPGLGEKSQCPFSSA